MLDVAHNPHSGRGLAANLDSMGATFPTTHAVFGAMADKDLAPMLEKISPLINRWYFTDLPVPRAAMKPSIATPVGAVWKERRPARCLRRPAPFFPEKPAPRCA